MAKVKGNRRNDEIEASEVRVIDSEGNQIGIRKLEEAQEMASAAGLDLVEIAPTSEPPVCRIMDYGKYRFQQDKKKQAARKKQKQVQIKEVKFRPATDDADYQIKMRNLFRFLDDGNKVKVTIRFRGREMAHKELGAELLDRVENDAAEYATVEQRPQMEGRQMVMVLTPRK